MDHGLSPDGGGGNTSLSRSSDTPRATAALAKRCGYHPLALTLAAKRLHKRAEDSTTPVASFNASESRLLELLSDGGDTVRASIALSYGELNDADRAQVGAVGG